jgi:thiol-disulfide isomerase/thioredoxin
VSISKLAPLVVLVTLTAAAAEGQSSRYFSFSADQLQRHVNTLDVVDMGGRRWTAADLRGRVVLLEFWATWCAPCLDQIPMLRGMRKTYGPERFEVIGLSLDSSSRRDFVAWINRQALPWPIVHDGRAFNGRVASAFGVQALPASLLLDADGRIAAQNLRGERLKRAVDALVQRASASNVDAARIPIVIR